MKYYSRGSKKYSDTKPEGSFVIILEDGVERFVVGSGRCGSTLLSNMLAKHPEVAVLSEFFSVLDRTECFRKDIVTGIYFSEFLGRSNVIADIIIRRGKAPEELLSDTQGLEKLPALLVATVPALFSAPATALQEILDATRLFPDQTFSQHYKCLFEWLCVRTGKKLWIERSGPSNEYLPDLIDLFPDALFVHLHRDGPESALSMQQHTYFQLVVSLFFDPPDRHEIEATEYAGGLIGDNDPFTRRLTSGRPPPEKFGAYWSYQQTMGFRGLARLNLDQYLEIRFEDLVAQPHRTMARIADFLQLPGHRDWIDEAAKLVKETPPDRLSTMSLSEQAAIIEACRTGQLLLGREVSPWINPTLELIGQIGRENELQ